MDFNFLNVIGYLGPGLMLGLSAIGSAMGVSIGAQASHGAMESDKVDASVRPSLLILSLLPSTQALYGVVLQFTTFQAVFSGQLTEANSLAYLGLGLFGGLAIMYSAIMQGKAAATAVKAVAKNKDVFGLSIIGPAVIEGFAIFVFVIVLIIAPAVL